MADSKEKFMREAIRQAKKAYALGEAPIGCVIVREGKIIARGYNRRNTEKNALAHAELAAIKKASKQCGDWHATLYHVCYVRALPDVCRSNCAVTDAKGSHSSNEPQSRVRRIGIKPFANGAVQPSGRN